MVYNYNTNLKKDISKLLMAAIALVFAMTLVVGLTSNTNAVKPVATPVSGPVTVTVDTEVNAGIKYGDGIDDGEWVTAERLGIQIGLRATDRYDGLLDVTGTRGNRVGVYEVTTGEDRGGAEWNYEWSVDLSGGEHNAAGRTLDDYDLVLRQDFTEQSLYENVFPGFGLGYAPVLLPMPQICANVTSVATLCQQSWNPVFGNTDFDVDAEGTYNLKLILTPSTFNGPPLAVSIQVVVSD